MQIESQKSRTILTILTVLFGLVGVHEFYLGRISRGVIKLITFDYLGIGWLVDIILAVTGTQTDYMGAYVSEW